MSAHVAHRQWSSRNNGLIAFISSGSLPGKRCITVNMPTMYRLQVSLAFLYRMAPIVGEVEGPRLAAIFTMQESLSERLAADQHSSRLGDRPLTFSEMPPGPHITQYYCDNWDDVPLVWGSSAPSSSTYPVFGWHLYGDVAKGCPPPSVIATASPPVPPDPITPPPPPPGKPLPSTEQPTPPPSYPPPWKAHLYPPFMPKPTDPSPSEEDDQLPAAKSVPELDDPAPLAEEGKRTNTEMLPPCSTHKSSESTKPRRISFLAL